jgi:hypothetical protein
MRSSLFGFSLVALCLAGCEEQTLGEKNPDKTDDPDTGGLEEIPVDSGDTGSGGEDGVISGVVTVSLFTYDDAGELEWSDWDTAYPDGDFPFGSIFVGAYKLNEDARSLNFLDQYVIRSPNPAGNRYELQVDPEIASDVRVYAILDYWGDGILATNEPVGVWPTTIPVSAGTEVSDVNVDIPAPYYNFDAAGGGGGGGGNEVGGGGAGGAGGEFDPAYWMKLSGAGLITESYAGGSCVAMIYGTDNLGPYYADPFTPVKNDAGAEGSYSMWLPKNYGDVKLLGAWDSNYNGLIDPADTWGEYVDGTGAPANPLTIGDVDLPDHTLVLPSSTPGVNPSLVPFVVISGDLQLEGGFGTLSAGAQVIVTAMKYKPDAEISAGDIPSLSYDYHTFSGADLTGDTLAYSLVAPTNTIVYLWAYVDSDGDGLINEVGEAVASAGSDPSGHLATGTDSHPGVDLPLRSVTK